MSRVRLKQARALIRVNLTPPKWEALPVETRGRLVAFVMVRQGGLGDIIATPTRLYAQMTDDLSAAALRAEVSALVDMPPALCPAGCGADLAIGHCRCDELERQKRSKAIWDKIRQEYESITGP